METQLALALDLSQKDYQKEGAICLVPKIELRPYQKRLLDKLYDSLKIHNATVLFLPTGGGKTETAIAFILNVIQENKTVLFVVNRQSLIGQTISRFKKYGLDCGAIAPRYKEKSCQIQVAMIQTWIKRSYLHKPYDVVIVDECHGSLANSYNAIFDLPHGKIVGLTATPFVFERGKKLADRYTDIIHEVQTIDLVEHGFLVKPIIHIFSPEKLGMDDKSLGVNFAGTDFNPRQLNIACNSGDMIAHLYQQWLHKGYNLPTLAFAVNVDHSKNIVTYFRMKGVTAEHIDAKTSSLEREEIYTRFRTGQTKLISSVDVLSEGFDMPTAVVGLMARPTKSMRLWLQQVGRLLRLSEGKKNAILIDQACNIWRFGHPLEKIPIGLDTFYKPKGTDLPPVKKCVHCEALIPISAQICPYCGGAIEIIGAEKDHIDKDLQELRSLNEFLVEKLLMWRSLYQRKVYWCYYRFLAHAIKPTIEDFEYLGKKMAEAANEKGKYGKYWASKQHEEYWQKKKHETDDTSGNFFTQFLSTSKKGEKSVKKLYYALAKTHHPDVGGDAEVFRTMKEAFDLVMAKFTTHKQG